MSFTTIKLKEYPEFVNTIFDYAVYNGYSTKVDKVVLSIEQIEELCAIESHNFVRNEGIFTPNITMESFLVNAIDSKECKANFLYIKHKEEKKEEWFVYYKTPTFITLISAVQRTPKGFVVTGVTKDFYPDKSYAQIGAISIQLFAAIQNRLSYTDDFNVEEKKITTSTKKKKPGKKAYTQHKVRLYKCYTLTRVAPVKNLTKRKVIINCPAWGVRGHYRHYKNGKVIFISPYTKGKDRNNYQSKEYGLFPNRKEERNEINRTNLSAQ